MVWNKYFELKDLNNGVIQKIIAPKKKNDILH